jgi:hypothetical protein
MRKDFEKYSKKAFASIAVSAKSGYRGPAAKKERAFIPEHREDKPAASKKDRKKPATSQETKAAALQFAREILTPWVEGGEFSEAVDEASGRAMDRLTHSRACRTLGELRASLSGDELRHCDLISMMLRLTSAGGPELIDDAAVWFQDLDLYMSKGVRKRVGNLLRSFGGALREVSGKGPGQRAGKACDVLVAMAVVEVAKGFDLPDQRPWQLRDKTDEEWESGCSIVREVLNELLPVPLKEEWVERSYARGKRKFSFTTMLLIRVTGRLGIDTSSLLAWVHGLKSFDDAGLTPFVGGLADSDRKVLAHAVERYATFWKRLPEEEEPLGRMRG